MSKHRVVKSDFWVDDYVSEKLTIKERYFFLYLLTNPNTNILGIYQTTIKRMCFESGLEETEIENCLFKLKNDDKVHFVDNYILMVNFQKHQNPSGTMKTGIQKLIQDLPEGVIKFIFSKESKIYDRLYRGYLIDYVYPYINKDKDKDINTDDEKKDAKPKKSKFSPLKNRDEFIENIPESIKLKYPDVNYSVVVDDIIDYCERVGKTYSDYYAAMRTFIKGDKNNKYVEKHQNDYFYQSEITKSIHEIRDEAKRNKQATS